MQRRGFLGAILAACSAPAFVRAGSLMRVNPLLLVPATTIWTESSALTFNAVNFSSDSFKVVLLYNDSGPVARFHMAAMPKLVSGHEYSVRLQ